MCITHAQDRNACPHAGAIFSRLTSNPITGRDSKPFHRILKKGSRAVPRMARKQSRPQLLTAAHPSLRIHQQPAWGGTQGKCRVGGLLAKTRAKVWGQGWACRLCSAVAVAVMGAEWQGHTFSLWVRSSSDRWLEPINTAGRTGGGQTYAVGVPVHTQGALPPPPPPPYAPLLFGLKLFRLGVYVR